MRHTHGICWMAGMVMAVVALLALPAGAGAFAFHPEEARDWAQAHYDDALCSNYYDNTCTVLPSLAYRKGAGVPFRDYGYYHTEAFWADPDSWGASVALRFSSPGWINCKGFRDHFDGYPPSGNDWVRVTRHRCSVAPDEDDRWAGGYVVFYHHSVDNDPTGACSEDYYHSAVVFARHTQSHFNTYRNYPWGTCKVDRYRDPNLINLTDRYPPDDTKCNFVQVNTLVYNP